MPIGIWRDLRWGADVILTEDLSAALSSLAALAETKFHFDYIRQTDSLYA